MVVSQTTDIPPNRFSLLGRQFFEQPLLEGEGEGGVGACCIDGECVELSESECNDAGGEFHEGLDCDPNPCLGATGACCFEDGFCEELTESECAEASGSFQGEGQSCSPNPCVNCPGATLVCDSIEATKNKCGYQSCDPSDLRFYKTLTKVAGWSGSMTTNYDFSGPGGEIHDSITTTNSGEITWIGTKDPATGCGEVIIQEGSLVRTVDCSQDGTHAGTNTWTCSNIDLAMACPVPGTVGITMTSSGDCASTNYCGLSPCTSTNVCDGTMRTEQKFEPPQPGVNCTVSGLLEQHRTTTVSDEYTTEQLKTDTINALPPYCGDYGCFDRDCDEAGQGCSCSAVFVINSEEDSCTIRRFKFRFLLDFSAPAFAVTRVHWTERFTPEDGSDPTDTNHSTVVGVGGTQTGIQTQNEPSEQGTIDIVSWFVTCE